MIHRTLAAGLAALFMAGCSGVGTSTPPPESLTGFGATDAAWDASHTADPNPKIIPGAAYDPDPAIGMDRYQGVEHSGGHVVSYIMRFAPTTLPRAEALAMAELPPDAQYLWRSTRDMCMQMQLRSATLGRALGGPGDVFVNLDTAGEATLDEARINDAFLMLASFSTAQDAPGC